MTLDYPAICTVLKWYAFLAVALSVWQDISYAHSLNEAASDQSGSTIDESKDKVAGLVLHVTRGYSSTANLMLKELPFGVQSKSYAFQGSEWWLETFLDSGSAIIAYSVFTRMSTSEGLRNKLKMVALAIIAIIGWYFITPQFRTNRVAVKFHDKTIYESEQFEAQHIKGLLQKYQEEASFTDLSEPPKMQQQDSQEDM